ncbi:prepilin-type N-terminal cleavage/methylation domain-containing protein [Patescibacteria group bacterium]|nr:prepilin-type N-terminal cleavage/methylation domain-containing protein [Patescibacteria group bacterium]
MNYRLDNKKGFTLIELMVVISIIALISSVIIASLTTARYRAQDTKKIAEAKSIANALELYYSENKRYPNPDYDGCGGWDIGNRTYPLLGGTSGALGKFISDPRDQSSTDSCTGYFYYRYPAGNSGCDASRGAFYVIGIRPMKSQSATHPQSPGWSCPGRNWQGEFSWVMGNFEN